MKNRTKKDWSRRRRDRDRRSLRELEGEAKDIVVKARRKKIPSQVENTKPVTGIVGNCCAPWKRSEVIRTRH